MAFFDVFFARLRAWGDRHALAIVLTMLAILFLAAFLHRNIFIVIYPGEVGVQWSRFNGGTITDRVYKEGLHAILPWNKMYTYNVRYQRRDATYEVLTSDGLTVGVEVAVRFRLAEEAAGFAHKYVGPNYVETLLIPEIGSFLREQVAGYRQEELYSTRRFAIQEQILAKTRTELRIRTSDRSRRELVELQDVLLRDIVLPAPVAAAIESKLTQEQLMLEYDYVLQREEKEKDRKRIEAEGIRAFQDIVAEGISDQYLRWKGIDATLAMATSSNAKIVVIGAGTDGLPIILGNVDSPTLTDAAAGEASGSGVLPGRLAPPRATDGAVERRPPVGSAAGGGGTPSP